MHTVAVGHVELQEEYSKVDDLLCCVDNSLDCCLFLSSAAGKPHWDVVCQCTFNRASTERQTAAPWLGHCFSGPLGSGAAVVPS